MVDGFALRVEDPRFERDENARLHVIACKMSSGAAPMTAAQNGGKLYRLFTLASDNMRRAGQFFTGGGRIAWSGDSQLRCSLPWWVGAAPILAGKTRAERSSWPWSLPSSLASLAGTRQALSALARQPISPRAPQRRQG